jgi:hypothetical protein
LIEPVHRQYCQVQTTVHAPYLRLKLKIKFRISKHPQIVNTAVIMEP